MTWLGQDSVGEWLYAPRGAAASYETSEPAPLPVNFLTLVPHDSAGWIATWMWGNREIDIELYVDLVVLPEWVSDECLKVIDLDLDVIRYVDGRTVLDDEDEFELNRVRLGYPEETVTSARILAETLTELVQRHVPPLASASRRWMQLVPGGRQTAEDPAD